MDKRVICQSLWKLHITIGVGDVSLLLARLGLFPDRTQAPALKRRDVETTNASPQRRSFSVLDASRGMGKSVNAMWPLLHLINGFTKTHVCFYALLLAKNMNHASMIFSCEIDSQVMHAVSPGFERGNKSISVLLLIINYALKFYSLCAAYDPCVTCQDALGWSQHWTSVYLNLS